MVPRLLVKDMAVGRPRDRPGAIKILAQLSPSELPPVGAICINNPDLARSALIGAECDSRAIWRPSWAELGGVRECQLYGRAAFDRHLVNVLLGDECDPFAVG
jgi:hypothetical protein